MSPPLHFSGNDMTHDIMDGILHNLARKQREEPVEHCTQTQSSASSGGECSDTSHYEPPKETIVTPTVSRPVKLPLKSILKGPRVRFVDTDLLEDVETRPIHPLPLLNSRKTLLLPSPAPPPPPPPPRHPPQLGSPPDTGPLPPSLFNSKIEADEYLSEAAYKLYAKFFEELSQFVNQQGEVLRSRVVVQGKRAELRRLREEVSQCDMLLIDHVRKCVANEFPSNDAELMDLFESAQAARDHVGPIEAEYELLEVDLGAAEHKLKEKYSELELRFEHFFRLKVTSSRQSAPSKIEYEASSASSVPGGKEWMTQEPRYTGLLYGTMIGEQVGIGQLPMILQGGISKVTHSQVEDPREMKDINQPSDPAELSANHRSTVTGDEKAHVDMSADLMGISGAEAFDLTQSQELETRDVRISRSLTGLAIQSLFDVPDDPSPFSDDLPTDPDFQEVDTLLLLENDMDDKEMRSTLSDYLVNFDSTGDRINQWMLHQLRISRRETYALRKQVLNLSPKMFEWAIVALAEWSNDDLGRQQPYYLGSIEDDSDEVEVPQPQEIPSPEIVTPQENIHICHHPHASLVSNIAFTPTISDLNKGEAAPTPQDFRNSR